MLAPIAAAPAANPAASDILVELTAGLAAGDDLRELLARFLEPIMRIAGAQAGAVRVLVEPRQFQLVGEVGLPASVQAAERLVESHCGLCGEALAADRPVWSDDLAPCARRTADTVFFGEPRRRALAVPLRHRARVLGVFNLFFDNRGEPAPEVMSLLKAIGDLLGLALHNARLEREQLRAAAAAERSAMAADVHDSIGQALAFVKMRLPLLHDAMCGGDAAGAERYFEDVRSALAQAHSDLRGILTQARTPIDPLGLSHALADRAEVFRRSAGVSLELIDEAGPLRLDGEREVQVFHVVQEALANIERHAQARRAWLRLSRHAAGAVRIVVEDDGRGLGVAAPDGAQGVAPGEDRGTQAGGSHFGLSIMRERARRLGGTLAVLAREGGGTRVQLDFPLHDDRRARAA